ncbi:MAG: hypothetical protein AMXMBFR20_22650 [Planctomycetia bacterium]
MLTNAKARASTPTAYVERVNLAVDRVVSHLTEPLRLKEVSRAATICQAVRAGSCRRRAR